MSALIIDKETLDEQLQALMNLRDTAPSEHKHLFDGLEEFLSSLVIVLEKNNSAIITTVLE